MVEPTIEFVVDVELSRQFRLGEAARNVGNVGRYFVLRLIFMGANVK